MKVWVTRTLPEAARTAERLRALGHDPVIAPLLEVHVLRAAKALRTAADTAVALAFTSVNGVRAFAELAGRRNLPAFTVGDATAMAAREAGFADVISAEGDVAALAASIRRRRPAGTVLHPSAAEPAGDLIADLRGQGLKAEAVAVYETRPIAPPAGILDGLDAVLIHSARAARQLATALADRPEAANLTVACISQTAAEPLAKLKLGRLLVAAHADDASLIVCLVS